MGRALESIPLPELRDGYYSELVGRLEQARPASPRPLRRARVFRFGMAAAAAAAAVTVAVVLFGLPGLRSTGPQPSLAAQVLARMTSSLAEVRSFESDEVTVDYKNDGSSVTRRGHVVLTAAGDGRQEYERGKWVTIHNNRLGVQWSLKRSHGALVALQVSTGLPAGSILSNIGDSSNMFMWSSYGTALRALLAAHQPGMDVRPSSFDSRPAWTVTFAYDPANAIEMRLTIDQQTGLVFAAGEYKGGRPVWERRVENVRINQPLATGLFRPPAALHLDPARAIPPNNDNGFERVPLARVEGLAGYAPLVPTRVPAGYALADVTVLPRSGKGLGRSHGPLVSLVYRRGIGSFTVAIMPDGTSSDLTDLSGGAVTGGDLSQKITLGGGTLSGSQADIFIGLWAAVSQIYVHAEGMPRNVVIRGDLTRDELVSVAESLQPYTGGR